MSTDRKDLEIHIDVSLIPTYTQNTLADATLDMIKGILKQPNGRELLDKKINELQL